LASNLRAVFSPFAADVEFLTSNASDARAIFWKKNFCIIPIRLANDLLSKAASERRKQVVIVTVAHELGHLISRDTQEFMLCRVLFVYGITSAICMWWVLLLGRLHFNPYAVLGVAYVAGTFLYMMYEGVRKREFFADRIGAVIGGESDVKSVLQRKAREEKHLKYSLPYKLTHPSFRSRSRMLDSFGKIYRYSYASCFFSSLVIAINIGALPFASKGSTTIGGFVTEYLIVALAIWLNFYFTYTLVVPATLVGELTFTGLIARACVLVVGIGINIDFLSLTLLNREWFAWGIREGLLHTNQIIGGVVGTFALHVSYWLAGRQTLSFRGPKRPNRAFYRRLFWSAGIGGSALASFLSTSGLLVITLVDHGAAGPDNTPEVLISVMAIWAAAAALCALYWYRYVRRCSMRWGSVKRSSPQFVEGEWEARHELRYEEKTSFFFAVLGYLLSFAAGLVILPTTSAAVGQDPITAGLAWIVAFPIIVIISRRNRKKLAVQASLVAV
jgi:hypothetical protein